jgi:hypothetical protein
MITRKTNVTFLLHRGREGTGQQNESVQKENVLNFLVAKRYCFWMQMVVSPREFIRWKVKSACHKHIFWTVGCQDKKQGTTWLEKENFFAQGAKNVCEYLIKYACGGNGKTKQLIFRPSHYIDVWMYVCMCVCMWYIYNAEKCNVHIFMRYII